MINRESNTKRRALPVRINGLSTAFILPRRRGLVAEISAWSDAREVAPLRRDEPATNVVAAALSNRSGGCVSGRLRA